MFAMIFWIKRKPASAVALMLASSRKWVMERDTLLGMNLIVMARKVDRTPLFTGDRMILQYNDGDDCPGGGSYKKSAVFSFQCDKSASESVKLHTAN